MTTFYLGSYLGYMVSTAKQNLVYIVRGEKPIFVKSVSSISPVKAIHHSIKRQSRGKSEKLQTDMSDWAQGED